MIIQIDKSAFRNLPNGKHSLKLNFNDGYSMGEFEIKNKISFTIMGETFTATEGMTWADWIVSCGQGSTGNTFVNIGLDNSTIYIDYLHFTALSGVGTSFFDNELRLYDSNDML
jgi:hypothetical protein